ncbi:hypothetical protein CAPTEDRAFT_209855 [Capitella teleta]|uniref:C-type lectin domain-containing protein n=1 Tax=Capitella teleta TaxID=283909 RepID=R7TH64_CAPTE|nr:hypothetical protein CAPTEDRAFT_209855 [Capitella teleta]|eukprot:ELT90916.1 hypothetical protein CAPTEDRAFT_209855 [Capitella teleta]
MEKGALQFLLFHLLSLISLSYATIPSCPAGTWYLDVGSCNCLTIYKYVAGDSRSPLNIDNYCPSDSFPANIDQDSMFSNLQGVYAQFGLAGTQLIWTAGSDAANEGQYVWSNGKTFASTFVKWSNAQFPTGLAANDYIATNVAGFQDKSIAWATTTRPYGILCQHHLSGHLCAASE